MIPLIGQPVGQQVQIHITAKISSMMLSLTRGQERIEVEIDRNGLKQLIQVLAYVDSQLQPVGPTQTIDLFKQMAK